MLCHIFKLSFLLYPSSVLLQVFHIFKISSSSMLLYSFNKFFRAVVIWNHWREETFFNFPKMSFICSMSLIKIIFEFIASVLMFSNYNNHFKIVRGIFWGLVSLIILYFLHLPVKILSQYEQPDAFPSKIVVACVQRLFTFHFGIE